MFICYKFCFHDCSEISQLMSYIFGFRMFSVDFPLEITILKSQNLKIFACGAELDSELTKSKPLEIADSE